MAVPAPVLPLWTRSSVRVPLQRPRYGARTWILQKLKACRQGWRAALPAAAVSRGARVLALPKPEETHPGWLRLVLGRGTRGGGPRAGHPAPVAFAVLALRRDASRRGTVCRARGPARRVPLPRGGGARSPSIARSPPPTGPGGRTAATAPSPFPATASGHCRRRLPGASAEPDSPRSKMAAPMLP